MRKLSTNILKGSPSNFFYLLLKIITLLFIFYYPSGAFQTEILESSKDSKVRLGPLELLEAGMANQSNVSPAIYFLSEGDYSKALAGLSDTDIVQFPWLKPYLEELGHVAQDLVEVPSDHFVLRVQSDQLFLANYALPALETAYQHFEDLLSHSPRSKIIVEIYSTKADFSVASTLSEETLKRSGAIGICKFHRLMIVSPQSLPLGYRWMDALVHELVHLLVNEITHSQSELWLQEGTARYLETSYRLDPPYFLTPNQKTKLKEAVENNSLISFQRMSPSLVFLKDQEEVSLAFSQVSYSVSDLIERKGTKKFKAYLNMLSKSGHNESFSKVYRMTPQEFEKEIHQKLAQEKWEKTKGAMSDEIQFENIDEEEVIGASVKSKVRLGDRMRRRGHLEAALIEYEKALREEPDNAIILLKSARTLLALNRGEEAVTPLRRAVEKNPNYGTPYIELARLVSAEESRDLLLEANAINPFNPIIHQLLAQCYRNLGQTDLAKKEADIFRQLARP